MKGYHSEDIKYTFYNLIDSYLSIFKEDKIYTGADIIKMLEKMENQVNDIF